MQLNLPWPLPSPGATISLTWGGDDGSVPLGPLGLSHLDATLIDHCDSNSKQASDHYVLLAHRSTPIAPDLAVTYDPITPGVLNLQGESLTAWQGRTAGMLPDLVPDNTSKSEQMAPVVPQDAHFTLNFAHPTVDGIGIFANAIAWSDATFPKDTDVQSSKAPPPPNQVGKDDMSDINPNPPSVPFLIRHTLTELDLYQCASELPSGGQNPWALVYSSTAATAPENLSPAVGVTQLYGTWLTGDPSKANPRQVMTQLKVFPWQLLPGVEQTAQWNSQSQIQPESNTLNDQGLTLTTVGALAPTIGNTYAGGSADGLEFSIDGKQANPTVTIRFPLPSVVNSVTGFVFEIDGEFFNWNAPECTVNGSLLMPQSSYQDPTTQAWTVIYPTTGPAVDSITIPIAGNLLLLYSIDYATAPVPAAILPTAPALYALKTVTKIEAGRTGSSDYQVVTDGYPIVEFTYFQTASGPATASHPTPPGTTPVPAGPPPYPKLAANCGTEQQPASAFPFAGRLADLRTYTQWSWPLDGATAAYFGYDLNMEFVETYVNALYTAFSYGDIDLSLHFRCVDRNNNHTLLYPNARNVPSIPQQSALVATQDTVPLPSYVQQSGVPSWIQLAPLKVALEKRAAATINTSRFAQAAPMLAQTSLASELKAVSPNDRTAALSVQQISRGSAGGLLHDIAEYQAGLQVQAMWFRPLLPATRYTLDLVAGPLVANRDRDEHAAAGHASLDAVFEATDSIGLLAALQAYFGYEDPSPAWNACNSRRRAMRPSQTTWRMLPAS